MVWRPFTACKSGDIGDLSEFSEYARQKYQKELDDGLITMFEDLMEMRRQGVRYRVIMGSITQ